MQEFFFFLAACFGFFFGVDFFSSFVCYFSLLLLLLINRSKLTCIERNCGALVLTGYQVYTKATLPFPTSTGQGRENTTKSSRGEMPHLLQPQPKQTWGN